MGDMSTSTIRQLDNLQRTQFALKMSLNSAQAPLADISATSIFSAHQCGNWINYRIYNLLYYI